VDYYGSIIPDPNFTKEHNPDICFIGFFDRHREIYLKALSGFNLGIWSWNIKDFDTPLRIFHKGTVFGENMIKIIKSSKIALNIHRDFEVSGGNYRLFEIAACKTFQLVDEKKDIGKYFKIGKEIITFSNENDLKEKVEYYLNHPDEREEIANAAYNRVKHDHTLVHRMTKIINLINSS
jgi:spore maturation protein CgeB